MSRRAVGTALRLAALSALVAAASAFDWKPKPTAQLKADLVAYAREAGEGGFADAVEKTTSTAEWMRLAFKRGGELLKASEGGDFDDERRMHGLRIVDYPLHLDNYDQKRSTAEDKRVFIDVVREYCADARDRVFREVAAAKVPKGKLRLWRIYNMGYVMKGPKHTVAIDVTARPEFYLVEGKRYIPQTNKVVWCAADWKRLAELSDMLFVTHPHGDHYNRAGIAAFVAARKPVVVPCDIEEYKIPDGPPKKGPDGKYIIEKENLTTDPCCVKLDRDHLEPVDVGGVKVRNFLGNQGKDTPCNVYLLDIDGVLVADNGDNYDRGKERMLAKCPPADVIIASTWNKVQEMVKSCEAAPGFDRTKSVLLPSHENELGHRVQQRESYWEMYTRQDRLGNREFPWPRVHPLGYGESFTFDGRPAAPKKR